jgi:hypothetical protein
MPKKPKSLRKAEFLEHWAHIRPDQDLIPRPVPYKHEGSTYAEDGIRITGTRQFIDAVLSNLRPLLAYENASTRLQVVYKQSTDKKTRAPINSWNCYIQVHTRGREAQMVNALFGQVS